MGNYIIYGECNLLSLECNYSADVKGNINGPDQLPPS